MTKKLTQKRKNCRKKPEVLHEKLKTVLLLGILKKKISTPNIFCKSFKQIKAYISPKNIEVYTIQVLCVTQATIEVIAKS